MTAAKRIRAVPKYARVKQGSGYSQKWRASMSYCKGECEYLNCKTHTCELTGEKLTYMKQTGLVSFTVHEHEGICEKEEG